MNILFQLSDFQYKEQMFHNSKLKDYNKLLGDILMNRVTGIVYDNIKYNNEYPSEFKRALKILTQYNVKAAETYYSQVKYISNILKDVKFKYALLKGAFLITQLYVKGRRTANDIDILISHKDIDECQKVLQDNGFVQGWYQKPFGIISAPRKEIIKSRINNGETIPFVKLYNGKVITLDLNFSVNYKPEPENEIVSKFLSKVCYTYIGETKFLTLDKVDFLIHLCCHLYKEATTYNWVLNHDDMKLYKFCDINLFLNKYLNEEFMKKLLKRITELELQNECYYAFENTSIIYPSLFENKFFYNLKESIKPNNTDFMKQIIWPAKKKIYRYDLTFEEWFMCDNKINNLIEVKTHV